MTVDVPTSYDVVSSTVAFGAGRVISVRVDEVALPGGSTVTRDVVVHPGAVGIVALDDDDRILLVQQYRHPVGRLLWEPPAGLLDVGGEPPLDTARRELFEETHHEASTWHVLVDAFTSPGMASEALRIYLARDLRSAEGDRHEAVGEEIDMPVAWMPLDEVVEGVLAGRLHNPVLIMGALAAVTARARDWSGLRPPDAPWPERFPGMP